MANEDVVERALRGVLRDYGWRVASDPQRLRAMLSDVLGADAAEHRSLVDALVLAAEHRVPAALGESETAGPDLVAELESWGLRHDRAEWAVTAWSSVAPRGTDPAPATSPPPDPSPVVQRPFTPDATALPPAYAATALPPAPSAPPVASASGPPVESPRDQPAPAWWKRRAVVASAVVAALAVTGGAVVLARSGDGSDHRATGRGPAAPTSLSAAHDALVVTDRSVAPKPLTHPVGMASKDVGVGLTALSDVSEVHAGNHETLGPPPGGRLIAFSLDHWACQDAGSCGPDGKVHVEIDGRYRSLQGHGPYVVAVAADTTTADLVMRADGVTQRISLLTGKADPSNIAVLGRAHHSMTLHRRFQVNRVTSTPIWYIKGHQATYNHTLDVKIDGAELDYFLNGKTPRDRHHAFLYVDYSYSYAGDPNAAKSNYVLDEAEVTFVARDGRRYHAKDLDAREAYAYQVFEVPASVQGGRFVIGGPQRIPEKTLDGGDFTSQIRAYSVRLRF